MSRLLFAAGRRARIEMLQCPADWVSTQSVPLDEYDTRFMHRRIHPDDAHLGYGPISTALRKQAATLEEEPAQIPYIQGFWDFTWEEAHTFDTNVMHRTLFLLILAEALAEDGL